MNTLKSIIVAGLICAGSIFSPASGQNCSGQPAANTVCAGPTSGGGGLPSFRALVPLDIPAPVLPHTHIFVGNGSNVATDFGSLATFADAGGLTLAPTSGNAITITGASGLNKSLLVTQTQTGSDLSGNNVLLNDFNLTNNVDTFVGACSGTCGAAVFGQRIAMTTTGASNQGASVSYYAEGVLQAARTGGQQWTGGGFWTNISTAFSSGGTGTGLTTSRGSIIPFFAGAQLSSGALNYLSIEGLETGIAMKTGSSSAIAAGLWIGRGGDAVNGAITDCAVCVVAQGSGGRWGVGLQIGDMASTAFQPVLSTGTLIKASAASGSPSVQSFIDFSAYACSGGNEINFTNFVVGCSGNITSVGNINMSAAATLLWTGRSILTSPADGQVLITNNAVTDAAIRLQLGGTTSSFVAIKRAASSTALAVRLADDSADAAITAAAGTFTGTTTVSGASLTLSGNQSAAAWTTAGIRYKNVTATLTDTTSSGTVAAAYTSVWPGNTIAASSATTFTDYFGAFFGTPTNGTNVTLTRKWGIGSDSSVAITSYLAGLAMKNESGALVTMIDNASQGRYLRFLNPDGVAVFQAGNTVDATMFIDHTTIQFTCLANSSCNYAKFTTTGLTIQTTTDATSVSTGAIQNPGGMSVNKRVWMDGLTAASGTPSSICRNANEITVNAAVTCTVSSLMFKHDWADITRPALPVVMALRPGSFFYNDNGDRQRLGFASEYMAAVDPRLADAFDADGHPRSIDQNAILAVTVKAVQELKIANDNLRSDIETLKQKAAR